MKLKKQGSKLWLFPLLAFAIPFIGMLSVMLISRYTPFGEYSMLYSDMYHQYYPFFVSFRNALRSGDSLLYIWNMGMGMDHLGLISYYLASPLNLLSVLIPESWLLQFFSLLVPIKLGLASLFFSLFLKKVFGKQDLSTALFSSFYGLCAWALGFQWNIMWVDTFALLPLVMIGMISLLKERKFLLYTFMLALSVGANYYIGFFICIFVLLVFICYEICRWEGLKKFWGDLWRMALYSGLGIGMTAFLELPALAALQCTQSSVNQFPTGFRLNIADENTWKGLLDAMRQVIGNQNGGLEPNFKEGLPNLYCGVITNLFAFLYLEDKQVRLRDKICSAALLLFFNLSFVIRQLDYIWHGFHFTNMIPYRFSFLYSFVLLYMGYSAYTHRKSFKNWQVLLAGALNVLVICMAKVLKDPKLWIYNGTMLVLYVTLLLVSLYQKPLGDVDRKHRGSYSKMLEKKSKVTAGILACFMSLELILNLVNFGVSFPGTLITYYPRGRADSAAAFQFMKDREKDTPFYRTEVTHTQTLNDGALNNYYGISTFTSSANVKVTEFMRCMGYGAKNTYNRYCYEESSPVANLFLGIKYMVERQALLEENPYFDEVENFGQVYLLENNAYLPLGFLANSQLLNVNFIGGGNPFRFQNELFSKATGLEEPVWDMFYGNTLTVYSQELEVSTTDYNGHCSYSPADTDGVLHYMFTADREGFMCINIDQTKRNGFTLYKNDVKLYSESYSLPQTASVCQVRPGDVIDVAFNCKANESGSVTVEAATVNDSVFRKGWEILNASTWELSRFRNTCLEGSIRCNRDGVLYTSIPDNGNWHAIVDGKPAQTVVIGECMLGVLLSEGEHEVTFQYKNESFDLGWKVSLGCLVAVGCIYLVTLKKKKPSDSVSPDNASETDQ